MRVKSVREVRRAQSDGTPDGFRKDGGQHVGGGDGAEKLRDPVEEGLEGAHALRHPEADRDRGIQVAAGNVADRGDHDGDGHAVRDGDAEQADARSAAGAEELVRANRAGADEDEREDADKFGGKLLPKAVQDFSLGQARGCGGRTGGPTARIVLNWAGRVKKYCGPLTGWFQISNGLC